MQLREDHHGDPWPLLADLDERGELTIEKPQEPTVRAASLPANEERETAVAVLNIDLPCLPVHGFLGHLIGAGYPCGGGIHERLSGGNERA